MERRNVFWYCDDCGAQNHEIDSECQWCELDVAVDYDDYYDGPQALADSACDVAT